MAFEDDAQSTVDAAFDSFGRAGTFQSQIKSDPPVYAVAVPVSVIPALRDAITDGFGGTAVTVGEALFQVRGGEILQPKKGDRLVVSSIPYIVASDPQRRDRFGLVWLLGTKRERT